MTTVPVLTAMTDAVREAELVRSLAAEDLGVTVVRRCVDLADVLAVAATGTARAVLLSADLRRLDRDAVVRLAAARVRVVAVVDPDDDAAERRLRQLGVRHVVPADAEPKWVAEAVLTAVAEPDFLDADVASYAVPGRARAATTVAPTDADVPAEPDPGRLIAVWGPTGAPGRTTVAVGLAAESANLGLPTLLVDGDTYGGVVAQVLGLVDESPGLAGAARLANNGVLDLSGLAELACGVNPRLRVLTGIARPDRWPELRPHAVDAVLALARSLCAVTVVDCGFSLEQDEELAYDTVAPRRNGTTLATVAAADVVVAVGTADPVGLQRLVRGLIDLRDVAPDGDIRVVVNRVRRGVVGARPESEIAAALSKYAKVHEVTFIPLDVRGCDAALAAGQTLVEAAPASPLREPLRGLAAQLSGAKPPARRRRLVRRG